MATIIAGYDVHTLLLLQHYEFEKQSIPSSSEEKVVFARKLGKYGMSLTQYQHILSQNEIKP